MALHPKTRRSPITGTWSALAGLFLVVCSGSGVVAASDPLDRWHLRNPLPIATPLSAVAQGNGRFLAVGWEHGVVTSPDGIHWTSQAFPVTGGLSGFSDIAFGNGRFAALDGGTNVWITTDGLSWTQRPVDPGPDFSSFGPARIAYDNGLFVAVGGSGLIFTSSDGDQWATQRVGQSVDFYDVTYGQGTFVAVGSSPLPGDTVFTSSDGSNWTAQDSGNDLTLGAITYGNGLFVGIDGQQKSAGGPAGSLWVLTSSDGTTWTHQDLAGFNTCSTWYSIAFLNGQFFACGSFTSPDCLTNVGNLLTSDDGLNWRTQTVGERSTELIGLALAGGQYVAVGWTYWASLGGSPAAALFSSSDGIDWSRRDAGIQEVLGDVAYGSGQFVAVGSIFTTNGTILTSEDGIQWTRRNSGTTNQLQRVAYGNGRFVVTGFNRRHSPATPALLTSTNGVDWIPADPATTNLPMAVAYGNGVFAVIAGGDTVSTSVDGTTWHASNGPANGFNSCNALAAGKGVFVAVGDHNWNGTAYVDRIFSSEDGVQWHGRTSGLDLSLRTVAFGNGIFVALPVGGSQVLTSPDGVQWSAHTVPFDTGDNSSTRYALAFGDGRFIAGGQNGSYNHTLLYTSVDGVSWETHDSGTSQWVSGLAFGAGTFVATCNWAIVQSDSLGGQSTPPRLEIPRWLSATGVTSTVAGDTGAGLEIQTSIDLIHWNHLTNLLLQTSPSPWGDASAVNASRKFYRAVAP